MNNNITEQKCWSQINRGYKRDFLAAQLYIYILMEKNTNIRDKWSECCEKFRNEMTSKFFLSSYSTMCCTLNYVESKIRNGTILSLNVYSVQRAVRLGMAPYCHWMYTAYIQRTVNYLHIEITGLGQQRLSCYWELAQSNQKETWFSHNLANMCLTVNKMKIPTHICVGIF